MAGRRRGNSPALFIATEYYALDELAVSASLYVTHEELLQWVWRQVDAGNRRAIRTQLTGLRRKLGEEAENPTLIFNEPGVGNRMAGAEERGEEEICAFLKYANRFEMTSNSRLA